MTDTGPTVAEFYTPGNNPADTAILASRAAAIADLAGKILREWPAYAADRGVQVPNPPRPKGTTALFATHAATVAVDAMLAATDALTAARTAAEAQTAALEAASDPEGTP